MTRSRFWKPLFVLGLVFVLFAGVAPMAMAQDEEAADTAEDPAEEEEPELAEVFIHGKRIDEFETIRRRKDGR